MSALRRSPWLPALVLLAALAVRLHGLDAQSLWYDEGLSLSLASRTFGTIARNAAADIHPPLYYWLLAAWVRVGGASAFSARYLSVLLGTALVAMAMAIGARLWSRQVGLVAGLLAAVSPYLVWYSQEARMYMLAAVLGAGLVWVTLDLVDRLPRESAASGAMTRERPESPLPGPPNNAAGLDSALLERGRLRPLPRATAWALLLALEVAALHTHYVGGASAVAVANIAAILGVARARTAGRPALAPWLGRWLAVQLVALLLFVPWMRLAWPALSHWPATSGPVSLRFALAGAARIFALGAEAPPRAAQWWLVFAACAIIGLARRDRWGGRWSAVLAAAWALTPAVLLWVSAYARPAWEAKQLIVGAAGFELLVAAGIAQLASVAARAGRSSRHAAGRASLAVSAGVAIVALVVLGGPRLVSLAATWSDPAYQRDDYRGIARDIAALAGPEDAVVLDAPTQVEVFDYYDRGRHVTYPLPRARPPDRVETERELSAISSAHRDLYAVLWATDQADPDGIVEGWLNEHLYKTFDRWYGNVRLAMWAKPRGPMSPMAPLAAVTFGDEIALEAIAHGPLEVEPGGVITLVLRWKALRQPRADYTAFTQLLDESGRIAAQRDMRPRGGAALTSTWAPGGAGQAVLDRAGLLLPRDIPDGDYRLIVGLYDGASGVRLPLRTGSSAAAATSDAYEVGVVRVR